MSNFIWAEDKRNNIKKCYVIYKENTASNLRFKMNNRIVILYFETESSALRFLESYTNLIDSSFTEDSLIVMEVSIPLDSTNFFNATDYIACRNAKREEIIYYITKE